MQRVDVVSSDLLMQSREFVTTVKLNLWDGGAASAKSVPRNSVPKIEGKTFKPSIHSPSSLLLLSLQGVSNDSVGLA